MAPQLSNLGICYEAIQRVYRNAVLAHLRSVLRTAHPDDYEAKVRSVLKKEWEDISVSARERRLTGEVTNDLLDDLDVLGVNHFYNLFEAFYLLLCPDDGNLHSIQAKINRQTLLTWAKAVKNLRDPLSHPSEADYSFEDSFSMLDPARRILLRFSSVEAANEVKAWMDELTGLSLLIKTEIEPLEDKLPPKESIIVDFVGRETELRSLRRWFDDSSSRRWALAGEGGKGKSAIAYRFATEIKFGAPEPFQFVLWLSAKRKRFDDGDVVDIATPDFQDLDSALNFMLSAYGWSECIQATHEEKKSKVMELLESFPALLIIDDADSLEGESEDAAEFFTFHVPRTRTKVLLTSRRVLFGMGSTTTHVSGLSGQDAADFVSSRCRLTELDVNIIKPHIAEMLKLTEGSPLYLEDLLRLCSVMPAKAAIAAWKDRSGDTAREYALGRELDLLTPRARQVLVAACMPTKPVSHYEIEAMTGLSSDEVAGSLKELQKLFLVPKPALFEGEERYNVNLNTRLLVKKTQGAFDSFRRIQEAWNSITKGAEASHDELVTAAIRRANLLVRARDVDKAEATLQTALKLRPNQPNLLGFLGFVYKAWIPRRLTDARETFERAHQLGCKSPDMYRHWCEMEVEQREWASAALAAEAGIGVIGNEYSLLHLAGYARQRLGKEFQNGLHNEKGREELMRARKWLELAIHNDEGVVPTSDCFRTLILVTESLRFVPEMREIFREWATYHPSHSDLETEWERLSTKYNL